MSLVYLDTGRWYITTYHHHDYCQVVLSCLVLSCSLVLPSHRHYLLDHNSGFYWSLPNSSFSTSLTHSQSDTFQIEIQIMSLLFSKSSCVFPSELKIRSLSRPAPLYAIWLLLLLWPHALLFFPLLFHSSLPSPPAVLWKYRTHPTSASCAVPAAGNALPPNSHLLTDYLLRVFAQTLPQRGLRSPSYLAGNSNPSPHLPSAPHGPPQLHSLSTHHQLSCIGLEQGCQAKHGHPDKSELQLIHRL